MCKGEKVKTSGPVGEWTSGIGRCKRRWKGAKVQKCKGGKVGRENKGKRGFLFTIFKVLLEKKFYEIDSCCIALRFIFNSRWLHKSK
jgi:hypothetical protein